MKIKYLILIFAIIVGCNSRESEFKQQIKLFQNQSIPFGKSELLNNNNYHISASNNLDSSFIAKYIDPNFNKNRYTETYMEEFKDNGDVEKIPYTVKMYYSKICNLSINKKFHSIMYVSYQNNLSPVSDSLFLVNIDDQGRILGKTSFDKYKVYSDKNYTFKILKDLITVVDNNKTTEYIIQSDGAIIKK
ncbi:hypothetical protein [Aureibacter tunicatorum]|uniref:Vacuolar-type H+-ATPase catalytic subunit A/Vma1 n=1 Tax=Aureibacter tunicatorum TaxID=866807 RepID=A0AAE3XJB7_9BACT|nr:hypothetical protein [Aureibacter tunicatorum]MDR6237455.1 vacuolar-type H+-ATPase catalytic subunit A/Vma1 [Aureibacter tunicatorum]BDD06444.1 hypothetical protein AUTU_39270 [Aureibacter tunicatorum]